MNPDKLLVESPLTSFLFSKASGMRVPLSGSFALSPVSNLSCRIR